MTGHIPASSFPTTPTDERSRAWLILLRDGNQNMSDKTSNLPLGYTSHTAFVKSVKKEAEENIRKTDCGLVSKQRGLSDGIAAGGTLFLHLQPMPSIPIQVAPDGLPSRMTMTANPSVPPDSAPPPYYQRNETYLYSRQGQEERAGLYIQELFQDLSSPLLLIKHRWEHTGTSAPIYILSKHQQA
ncbi:hypothetical protein K435DRAFT_859445 [Dendrothele bispora CBS 962.96]|uniref:Uncharacterized protein n=1 Tax=Dendrothele bispora (strain CBS 962.96) TaxID=1314807 RepID=A0A4S8M0Z6_DENBC|nr:hypothetical protein K435DRAFT_859445 [Dendrothele bispora CBS 962.96]